MADIGYTRSYRKLRDSDVVGRGLKTMGMLWWLLASVNYRARKFRGEWIHPGSMITKVCKLADIFGESDKVIRRILAELKEDGVITASKWANRWTKITVCNWATYQTLPCDLGRAEGRTAGVTEGVTKGELSLKKVKKERNHSNAPVGAHVGGNSAQLEAEKDLTQDVQTFLKEWRERWPVPPNWNIPATLNGDMTVIAGSWFTWIDEQPAKDMAIVTRAMDTFKKAGRMPFLWDVKKEYAQLARVRTPKPPPPAKPPEERITAEEMARISREANFGTGDPSE